MAKQDGFKQVDKKDRLKQVALDEETHAILKRLAKEDGRSMLQYLKFTFKGK